MKALVLAILNLFSIGLHAQSYIYSRANIIIDFDGNFELPTKYDVQKTKVESNRNHYLNIINQELNRYPLGILKNLKNIYVVSSLSSKSVKIGATNYNENIYIKISQDDYTFRERIHHEFAHLLHNKFSHLFPVAEWSKNSLLPYGKSGINAIKEGNSQTDLDTTLFQYGFLHPYSKSCLDEDITSYSTIVWLDSNPSYLKSYPLLYQKYTLMIQFYQKIDSQINLSYIKSHSFVK